MEETANNEIWNPIEGYEGLYEVSNQGRIKSIARTIICKNGILKSIKERIVKPCNYTNGYQFVPLSKDGIVKAHSIHRLVISAFMGYSKFEVNHKDGNKTNNRLDNLEYVTHSENMKHSFQILRNPPVKSWLGKRGFEHNKSIPVKIHNVITGTSTVYGSMRIAEENGYNRTAISKYVDTGKLYKHTFLFTTLRQ